MPAKPILVNKLLKSGNSVLASLQKTVSEQCSLMRMVKQIVPESISGVLLGCVQKNAELIIFTDSGAPASQLRFYGPMIKEILNARSGQNFLAVRIRVIQPTTPAPSRIALKKNTSLNSIGSLRGCSRFVSDHDLQKSLERLANTLENRRRQT